MSKSLKRHCADAWMRGKHIRVAVVGGRGCGKTSFITSVRSILGQHTEDFFGSSKVTVLQIEEDFDHKFDYDRACCELSEGRYPDQTVDWSVLRVRLKVETQILRKNAGRFRKCLSRMLLRGDVRTQYVVLDILDIPGERVPDFLMANKTYRQWSESLGKVFEKVDSYQEYLSAVRALSEPSANEVVESYRRFLPSVFKLRSSFYTPSTVRLTQDRRTFSAKKPEDVKAWVSDKPIGMKDAEFAPLPVAGVLDSASKEDKRKWKDVISRFENSYKKYNKKVLEPLFDWMRDVDRVYYLVDILTLLQEGRSRYEIEALFGKDIFHFFGCQRSTLAGLGVFCDVWHKIMKTEVDQVNLVVTQVDRIPYSKMVTKESSNAMCLELLARELHQSSIEGAGLRMSKPIICAAISGVTGVDRGGKGGLIARWDENAPREETARDVPNAPDHWPKIDEKWEPNQYSYPRPPLLRPADLRTTSPMCVGMARVVKSMLSGVV